MNLYDEPSKASAASRILDRNRLIARVAIERKHGARIVFANGCRSAKSWSLAIL
jgi:hypothetical protein